MDQHQGLFQRLAEAPRKVAPSAPPEASPDAEAADDAGTWGWLRGVRDRAQMVELRQRNGNVMAVAYGWVDRAEYDPSIGITLHVAGRKIVIAGRHLDAEARPNLRLFTSLCRHRTLWIAESSEQEALTARPGVTVIESIRW